MLTAYNKQTAGLIYHAIFALLAYCCSILIVWYTDKALYLDLTAISHPYLWLAPHGEAMSNLVARPTVFLAAWLLAIPVYFAAFATYLLQRTEHYVRLFSVVWGLLAISCLLYGLWVAALFALLVGVMQWVLGYRYQLRRRIAGLLLIATMSSMVFVSTVDVRRVLNTIENIVLAIPYYGSDLVNGFYFYSPYLKAATGQVQPIREYRFAPNVSTAKQNEIRTILAVSGWYDVAVTQPSVLLAVRNEQWAITQLEHPDAQVVLTDKSMLIATLNQLADEQDGRKRMFAQLSFGLFLAMAIAGLFLRLGLEAVKAMQGSEANKLSLVVLLVGLLLILGRLQNYQTLAAELPPCSVIKPYILQQDILLQKLWLESNAIATCELTNDFQTRLLATNSVVLWKQLMLKAYQQGETYALRQAFYASNEWYQQLHARALMQEYFLDRLRQ